ncbi:MAG TPA: protein kinase [Gemmatimonadales bacterium]|nr:protein kinase [Gemmatimonadales bacterium]
MPGSIAIRALRLGLAAKTFAAATLAIAAVLGVTFGLASLQATRTADAAIRSALAGVRQSVQALLADRTARLAAMSALSAEVPQFRERLLQSGHRSNVLDQAEEERQLVGAAWVLVTDERGILVARTDYPDEFDLDLSRGALIGAALSGDEASGAWLDARLHRLLMAVALPLRASATATPQGVLVAAYAIDDTLAQEIQRATTTDVVFFGLDTLGHPYIVGSTLPREAIAAALASDTAALQGLAHDSAGTAVAARVAGQHLLGLASPIRSAGGDLFGGFVAFRSRERELAAFGALQRTMALAVALGLGLALVAASVLARRVAGPIRELARATRRVEDGDYDVSIDVRTRDEIGALAAAFKRLVADLKEKAALVAYLASASGRAATELLPGATRPPAAADDLLRPGSVFAHRYDVQEVLGTGGMGVVYRAFDRELQEPVAIKTLRPGALAADGVALERFKQEIRLARRIAHRNVVRTYDLGEVDGRYYLTMEYVEGTSLKQLIGARGRLPVAVTLTIGKQVCRALEVAHEQGVIHRDIKPQNILVAAGGVLKVMDFGIARLADSSQAKGLTQEGAAIGTPDYMSPEQLSGLELDPRSDLYAAGVVLFECLTGRLPFPASTVYQLIALQLEQGAPDPRTLNPDIPAPLAAVVLKAMAKERADRYPSAAALHDALAALG